MVIALDIQTALTKGLVTGYAGQSTYTKVIRAGFDLESSHFADQNLVYHDEWLPARNGGGQELVKVNNQMFTRLYAGGMVSRQKLSELDLTEKQVLDQLLSFVKAGDAQTRLDQAFESEKDDWKYTYQVMSEEPNIELVVGKESILYKNQVVFIHWFLLSPVKK